MVVRDFRGRKFLSTSKEKSSIEIVEAVGEVVTESESQDTASDMTCPSYCWVRNVCVVGVMHVDKYVCCLKCKTKLVPDTTDSDLSHCSKCEMMQCLDGGSKGLI